MSTLGSSDAPIEIFGGLVTDLSPADLPHGVSPDCQDVIFGTGGVSTRPGLQALFGPLAGNPSVNYLKTFILPNGTLRTLAHGFQWQRVQGADAGHANADRLRAGAGSAGG